MLKLLEMSVGSCSILRFLGEQRRRELTGKPHPLLPPLPLQTAEPGVVGVQSSTRLADEEEVAEG